MFGCGWLGYIGISWIESKGGLQLPPIADRDVTMGGESSGPYKKAEKTWVFAWGYVSPL